MLACAGAATEGGRVLCLPVQLVLWGRCSSPIPCGSQGTVNQRVWLPRGPQGPVCSVALHPQSNRDWLLCAQVVLVKPVTRVDRIFGKCLNKGLFVLGLPSRRSGHRAGSRAREVVSWGTKRRGSLVHVTPRVSASSNLCRGVLASPQAWT